MNEQQRNEDCPTGWCRAQYSESLRSDVKEFRCEARQQRRRSTKKNGEQIEDLRSKERGLRHEKADADGQVLPEGTFCNDCGQPGVGDLSEERQRDCA